MPTYSPVPQAGQSLGFTRDTLKNNIQGIIDTIAINHFGTTDPNYGKHRYIQMPEVISAPATAIDEGAVYTKSINGTAQLFYRNENNGTEVQLTGTSAGGTDTVAATNGYTFLPGGILMQWGIKGSLSSTGSVSYLIPFPTNVFNVQSSLISKAGGTSSSNTVAPITGTITTSGFQYSYTGSSSYVSFYWVALGN